MLFQPRWGCIVQDVHLPIPRVFVVDVPAVLVRQCVQNAYKRQGSLAVISSEESVSFIFGSDK
jgi:hypothetical protein